MFFEKIFIQTPELNSSTCSNSNSVFDHQISQTSAIEKDNTLRKMLHEVARLNAESGGGDKNSLARAEPDKAAHKSLHIRSTDRIPGRVALGLNVDAIESQPIFIDHAINAAVTRSAKLGGGILV